MDGESENRQPERDTRDFGNMTDDEIDSVLNAVVDSLPPTDPAELKLAEDAFVDWDEV